LLRACQSTDNQFQALQNQEIEYFLVHSFQLPELEAEVVQIQLFIWISLCYLILVDQQDLVLGGFFVPLFWATCRLFFIFLLFWILEPFVCGYYYSVYPCPSGALRGSNFLSLLLLCFNLCPFVTKKGE
jgi:hypothetical protein